MHVIKTEAAMAACGCRVPKLCFLALKKASRMLASMILVSESATMLQVGIQVSFSWLFG